MAQGGRFPYYPEYWTDPFQIAEIIDKVDLISLQITRLKTFQTQLKSQLDFVGNQIEILEKARAKTK